MTEIISKPGTSKEKRIKETVPSKIKAELSTAFCTHGFFVYELTKCMFFIFFYFGFSDWPLQS